MEILFVGLVLIHAARNHLDMFGLFLLVFLLVLGPLAVIAGVDSRVDDVGRRRTPGR